MTLKAEFESEGEAKRLVSPTQENTSTTSRQTEQKVESKKEKRNEQTNKQKQTLLTNNQ